MQNTTKLKDLVLAIVNKGGYKYDFGYHTLQDKHIIENSEINVTLKCTSRFKYKPSEYSLFMIERDVIFMKTKREHSKEIYKHFHNVSFKFVDGDPDLDFIFNNNCKEITTKNNFFINETRYEYNPTYQLQMGDFSQYLTEQEASEIMSLIQERYDLDMDYIKTNKANRDLEKLESRLELFK